MNQRRRSRHSNRRKPKAPKFTNKLSEHFTIDDFKCAESGKCRLSLGLVGALELLKIQSNSKIIIVKGFEATEVAEKKGRVKKNYHTKGLAADIKIENLSSQETFKLAEQIDEIKGLGLNIDEDYVHIDTRKEKERLSWIEKGDSEVIITPENRQQFIES